METLVKNPSRLVSQELPSVTPKKESWKNINQSRSYKPLSGHFRKKHELRYSYSRFCKFFGGFHGIKWLIWVRFTFKLVCPSILLSMQMMGKNKFELEVHILKNVAKMH